MLDGPLFYLLLPSRVRRLVREHRPDAVVTQSPYEAAVVRHVTRGTRLVVELHGDWRTASRLYGSPLRRLLALRSRTASAPTASAGRTRFAPSRRSRPASSELSAASPTR